MKLRDISRPVHPAMAIYPNNPGVTFEPVSQAGLNSSALTKITLGSHTGTHIDASAHMDPAGQGTATYSLEAMNGPAEVIDLTSANQVILKADLPATSQKRIIIKTSNSQGDVDVFDPHFVALSEAAAAELVRRKIKLVGIDAPSVKKKGVKDQVHSIFLDAGVLILEGLWLANVPAGSYTLLCLPLHVDLDGAPVRAALWPAAQSR
jgi:arylformamidase